MATSQEALSRLNGDLKSAWDRRLSDYDENCKEISDYVYPNAKRFISGNDKHDRASMKKVLFNSGKRSLDTLASGMMSGTCSPSRPWFTLGVDKSSVQLDQQFKVALESLTTVVLNELAKSNFYRVMHQVFKQEGAFGTACALIDDFNGEDKDASAIDLILVPFGQYALSCNYKNEVDAIYRKLKMTVSDIMSKFGDKGYKDGGFPDAVQQAIDNKQRNKEFIVCHVIEKTVNQKLLSSEQAIAKNYSSYYFLEGEKDKFLSIGGFDSMPAIAPRWEILGDDVYGESPASLSLGDLREAQKLKLLSLEGTERAIRPPILLPTTMKDQTNRLVPGGVLFFEPQSVGESSTAYQASNAMNVSMDYTGVTQQYSDAISRIKEAFFTDLFLMLDQFDQGRMTATEVAERKNEKMLMLGAVLERQTDEALRPIIKTVVNRILGEKVLVERYKDIVDEFNQYSDQDYQIDFVSILSQAQKASGSANIERASQFFLGLANANPEFASSINFDVLGRHYSEINSIPSDIIKSKEEVDAIKQQQAQAQQAQQQAQLQQQQAQALQQGAQGANSLVQSAGVINDLGVNPNVLG